MPSDRHRVAGKVRRHTNNKGSAQVRRGRTAEQVRAMARRMGVRFGPRREPAETPDPAEGGPRT